VKRRIQHDAVYRHKWVSQRFTATGRRREQRAFIMSVPEYDGWERWWVVAHATSRWKSSDIIRKSRPKSEPLAAVFQNAVPHYFRGLRIGSVQNRIPTDRREIRHIRR